MDKQKARQKEALRRKRERMRKRRRQQMIRRYVRMGIYCVGLILAVVILVKGVFVPIIRHFNKEQPVETVQVQAADPYAAVRQPLKGQNDSSKIVTRSPGWHEDENGRWYQNPDGTYFVGGLQKIDGVRYSFDENGYIQTGWVSAGARDYYFNEDGSYNPDKKRPLLALTFDDGPGQYTDQLLDCLEANNAHATFFMLGEHVSGYEDTIKRMAEIGCEIGSHSWDHPQLTYMDLGSVADQFQRTDNALIEACGQPATVARAPYGSWSQDIVDTVGKPFFMWSLDSLDWSYMDADLDYNEIMNGDLTDGSIILMHDIHEPSVQAAIRIIPELIAKGYKLVTVSEMAEAKSVTLQNASYTEFWQSSLDNGLIAGYDPQADEFGEALAEGMEETSSDSEITDGSEEVSDGSEESSEGSEEVSDGTGEDTEYSDGTDTYSDGSGE